MPSTLHVTCVIRERNGIKEANRPMTNDYGHRTKMEWLECLVEHTRTHRGRERERVRYKNSFSLAVNRKKHGKTK